MSDFDLEDALNPIEEEEKEMEIKNKEIIIKNICPLIGMISSGKSSILNSLLKMDFFETGPDLTTKIITIIRYNKEIKDNPKFYKLILEKQNNDYKFYKDDTSQIEGKNEIKSKIKNINEELKLKNPQYEDIFYMLEFGQADFIEENFLENYDLVDMPGVSENVKNNKNEEKQIEENSGDAPNAAALKKLNLDYTPSTEEEMNTIKIEKEVNYLTEIFKILKNYIKCGVFIFSLDKFQLTENYMIIGKLKLILEKPIENFLILLNKMDISQNIEEDMKLLNGRFLQEFPSCVFNITRNTIIPCSSFQLENELNMNKNFPNLIYYHYINYIMNPNKYTDFIEYFKAFIKNYLKKKVLSLDKDEFKENIKSIEKDENLYKIQGLIRIINQNHNDIKNKLLLIESEFSKKSISECLEYLVEDDDGTINLSDQTNNTILFSYYYYLFKNEKINIFKSSQTENILNYFTIKNMNRDFKYEEVEKVIKEKEDNETYNKSVDTALEKINEFGENYEKLGINLNLREGYKKSIKPIINALKTSKMFFIPFIGVYNSGKSTILNNLIGFNLLPTSNGECTKRGILVKHWDYDVPIIRKAKFIVENTGNENDICYFDINNNILAQGVENVKKILKGINYNYIEKEEDFFYIVNIKIKFLDLVIFDSDERFKEKICFIDLPGYGTKNKFESKNIYSKFIKSCKLFIMVSRDHFEDSSNVEKINSILRITSKYQGISIQSLIKKFLFIINPSKNLDISESALLKKKKSLINNIEGLSENVSKYITVTFFNALNYNNYLSKKKYFNSLDFIITKTEKHYKNDKESYLKGQINCPQKFEKYLMKALKDNFKMTFDKLLNQITSTEIDSEIDKNVEDIVLSKNLKLEKNEIKDIKIILSYARNNIEKCKYFIESDYSNFKTFLIYHIIGTKYKSDEEFKRLIENNIENLNQIFKSDNNLEIGEPPVYKEIKNDFDKELHDFTTEISNKIKDIKLSKLTQDDKDIPKIFEESIETIIKTLKDMFDKIEDNLKKDKYIDIITKFENNFREETSKQKEKLVLSLEYCSDNIKKHYEEALIIINRFKNNPSNNFHTEELKTFISQRLGDDNDYKEAISNIVNHIISNSRNATNWEHRESFFEFLSCKISDKAYLKKTFTFIINKTQEIFKDFRKRFSDLIDEYMNTLLNKIDIEKNSLINNLEEQKRQKDIEIENNIKLNEIEKKKYEVLKYNEEKRKEKWNNLYQKYKELELLMKNIITNILIPESFVEKEENKNKDKDDGLSSIVYDRTTVKK